MIKTIEDVNDDDGHINQQDKREMAAESLISEVMAKERRNHSRHSDNKYECCFVIGGSVIPLPICAI